MSKRKTNRRKCAVSSCSSNRENNPQLVFAGIPKQTERYNEWIKNLELDPEKLTKLSHVCSLHFDKHQFTCPKRICLNKSAIPTILHSPVPQQTSSQQQQQHFVQPTSSNEHEHSDIFKLSKTEVPETVYSQATQILPAKVPTVQRIAPKLDVKTEPLNFEIRVLGTQKPPSISRNRKTERLFFKDSSHSRRSITNIKRMKYSATANESPNPNAEKTQNVNQHYKSIANCNNCKYKSGQIKRLNDQLRYCRRKISGLKKHGKDCVRNLVEKTPRLSSNARIFLQSQFDRGIDSIKNRRKNYTPAEKQMATNLMEALGTKGYQAMKNMGFLLPTIRTLSSTNAPAATSTTTSHNNKINVNSKHEQVETIENTQMSGNNNSDNSEIVMTTHSVIDTISEPSIIIHHHHELPSEQDQGEHSIIIIHDHPNSDSTTVHLESIAIHQPPL